MACDCRNKVDDMHFTLRELGLVDAPPEGEYDNLTSLACELLEVPVAHVSIADRANGRIFYKSQQGHPDELAVARELPMELTYCQHVALTGAPVVVEDARQHPLVQGTPAQAEGPLAYLGIPIEAPGCQVVGGLCMMQPTIRRWSDAEITRASKLAACVSDLIRLRAAMLTSERLRREQRDFTYSISHDLRSPANTVRMILDEIALERDRLSEDARMLIGEGIGVVDRMGEQIEDVLAYSRTVGNGIDRRAVELDGLMGDILADLRSTISEMHAVIDCGKLPRIEGDRMQLRALFHNLVANALKFSKPGVPPLVRIEAEFDRTASEHRISVSDNGIGIAPEHQDKVFELFSRLNLRDSYEGTGIGLTLCRRVAENHGGTVEIRSDGLSGCTFVVKLPGNGS